MLWIALEFDQKEKRWVPSQFLSKAYRKAAHVKSAMKTAGARYHRSPAGYRHLERVNEPAWQLVEERPELMIYRMVYELWNPLRRKYETRKTDCHLLFVEIAGLVRHLQIPATITQQPDVLRLPAQSG